MSLSHPLAAFVALSFLAANPVNAETVVIERGVMLDRPFTFIYPETLAKSSATGSVSSVHYPGVLFQCDAIISDQGPVDWTAEKALEQIDHAAIEGSWAANFPGFTITSTTLSAFQSGPAIRYEAESTSSPSGKSTYVVHTEAVDDGRTYVLECLMDRALKEDAKGLVEFLTANFSTRADGACCSE